MEYGLGGGPKAKHMLLSAHVKALQDRGVILAVCSKNEETDARLPFHQHPEMVLRFEDIPLVRCQLDAQAENLREIRQATQHRCRQLGIRRRQPRRAGTGAQEHSGELRFWNCQSILLCM